MYNIKHLIIFLFFIFIFLIVNSTTIVEDFDVVKKAKKLGKGVGNDILKGLKLDKKKI
jgi:hypothetical protein